MSDTHQQTGLGQSNRASYDARKL